MHCGARVSARRRLGSRGVGAGVRGGAAGARRLLALAERFGGRIDVAERADGHDGHGGEVVAEAERLSDPVAVEPAHLVGVQARRVRLHREVRGGLAGVVGGPRQRLAVERSRGGEHDQRRGIRRPRLVEAHQRVDDLRVLGRAAAGHDETPRLRVVRRRRPAGGLERARERRLVDRGLGVEDAGAPALGEHIENGGGGDGGAHGDSLGGGPLGCGTPSARSIQPYTTPVCSR